MSLSPFYDKNATHCLNEKSDHSLSGLLSGSGFLESDADEQLLLTVGFLEIVRPSKVKLQALDKQKAPSKVLVFTNNPSMDFEDAEALRPVQEFTLSPEDYDSDSNATLELRFVNFQRTSSLTLFIASNCGDEEETRVDGLSILSEGPLKKTLQLLDTPSQFQSLVTQSQQPVIVDCFAGWCGPCTRIAPLFEELANKYLDRGVQAYKLDIDKNQTSAKEVGVSSVPNFLLFNKGEKISEVKGADPEGLKKLFEQAAEL